MEYFVYELCFVRLAPFGSPRGALGLPLAVLWGPFGEPLGNIGNFIENWMSFTEKCVKFMKQSTQNCFWELASGARGASGASGSGVSKCCSDPPFHTRRGSG